MGVVPTISSPRDVRAVMNKNNKVICRGFLLFKTENPVCATRFAFVVTKKYGNAVERNRCKRRMREISRRCILLNNIPGDFVFLARAKFASMSHSDIIRDCDYAMRRFAKDAASS